MKVLYIAYSCSPIHGSEDRVGWNVAVEAAKKGNEIWVITKEEQRQYIEPYLKENSDINIKFIYVDIPDFYKKLFHGFLYSGRLNIWHCRALKVAKGLCLKENIEIIHQTTPEEFRAIGDYGSIPSIKFVCGPMGGGEYVPAGLWSYTKKHRLVEYVRMIMNVWYRCQYNLTGRFKRCNYFLYANKETRDYVGYGSHLESEMAVDEIYQRDLVVDAKSKCVFLVAGRGIYRKGYDFLLDTLETLPEDLSYEFRIVGDGKEIDLLKQRCMLSDKLRKHVTFVGRIPFTEMDKEYNNADVYVMPSIRETTGSVLYEAMSKGLPIIAIDKFGSAVLLNDNIGWTYSGNTRNDYIKSFAEKITECIEYPETVARKSVAMLKEAKKNTWEIRVSHYLNIYDDILNS